MSNDKDAFVTLISSLDFGDPLYLHASDTGVLTILSIKLTGTENYIVWANAMELALNVINKFGFVDKTCLKSTTNVVLARQWDRCNSVVISWILNSISEDLFVGQIFSKNASEVWNELKETYSKIDGSVIFKLHQQICFLKQNSLNVSEYYHKLTSLWRQFDSLSELPHCICDAEKKTTKFNQNIRLMQFLMGLDDCYQPLRSSILAKDPLPFVKAAFALISGEESHRGIDSSNVQPAAFVAKINNSKKPISKNAHLKCTNCNNWATRLNDAMK
ncbi:uncharacterized protein LOC143585111 [Bidens hawaiensis]|uniref:uncharacterized protein LOC143585111 n=1 Tax=Bidens hawaiensis TaxID=980011 RepID=UPI0040497EDD